MAARGEKGRADTLRDIELYLNDIAKVVHSYELLVDRLGTLKGKAKEAMVVQELLMERESLKQQFISKKQAIRSLLEMIGSASAVTLGPPRDRLKQLQQDFREIDGEFRSWGLKIDRAALRLSSESKESPIATAAGADGSHIGPRNEELVARAARTEEKTTEDLVTAYGTLMQARVTALETAQELEVNRETVVRIGKGLDEVQSESKIAKLLLLNLLKRLYTDKVIIALTTLLILAVVGVIIYASVKPNQNLFRVPDAVKPPINPAT